VSTVCELLAVAFPSPRPFSAVEAWASELERLGVAGFGWGAAWRSDGAVCAHRDPGAFVHDEAGRAAIRDDASDRWLVHLRRPSRLTTIQLADTQPFVPAEADLAFCHNGAFDADLERERYAARLLGDADSEVGFHAFLEAVRDGGEPAWALGEIHRRLGGGANLGCLTADGTLLAYHGFHHNPLWAFRLGDAEVASTGLFSDDDALFALVFPEAEDRRPIGMHATVRLGR
jgi:predicted glutamine amidotransferase